MTPMTSELSGINGQHVRHLSGCVMTSQENPPRGCAAGWGLPTQSLQRAEMHARLQYKVAVTVVRPQQKLKRVVKF